MAAHRHTASAYKTQKAHAETDTGQDYTVTQDHSRDPVDLDTIGFCVPPLQFLCKCPLSAQTGLETPILEGVHR